MTPFPADQSHLKGLGHPHLLQYRFHSLYGLFVVIVQLVGIITQNLFVFRHVNHIGEVQEEGYRTHGNAPGVFPSSYLPDHRLLFPDLRHTGPSKYSIHA